MEKKAQHDAHVKAWYTEMYQCKFCKDAAGYCKCLPPAEITVYNHKGQVIDWTGPIGCRCPEVSDG
jgi:hypothetical protein